MIRILLILFAFIVQIAAAFGQEQIDAQFNNVLITPVVIGEFSEGVEEKLELKLIHIITENGVANGSKFNNRFILTCNIDIIQESTLPGPPLIKMINFEIVFKIGDYQTKRVYSTYILKLKEVGETKEIALKKAIDKINIRDHNIKVFIKKGIEKIVMYYEQNCDTYMNEVKQLANEGNFEKAIYLLMLIPKESQICYRESLEMLNPLYDDLIHNQCQAIIRHVNAIWASEPNMRGAKKVLHALNSSSINPKCNSEISHLLQVIQNQTNKEEQSNLAFELRRYQDSVAIEIKQMEIEKMKTERTLELKEKTENRIFQLDKARISAIEKIAIEYMRNQPQYVLNNYYWR